MTRNLRNGSRAERTAQGLLALLALLALALAPSAATARSAPEVSQDLKRYIIVLQDPSLASYDGRVLSAETRDRRRRLPPTTPRLTRADRLDTRSKESQTYLDFILTRHHEFLQEASLLLGRQVEASRSYRVATNGVALDLSPAEAEILKQSALVKSLSADIRYRLQTYAGPPWIGAESIWNGNAGFPDARGEGVVIGSIDSGINWEHPSFDNPAIDGYLHVNPLGEPLGLCAGPSPVAQCNGKIIGIYDFVEDDPLTTDVVEENTNGRDDDGHGSHTISTAAGNRVNTFQQDGFPVDVSGVAPRANIIAYRVCFQGSCLGSAILDAIDQAITDGVDVINYSVGTSAFDPWSFGDVPRAFLNVREAGIFVATSAGNDGPDGGSIGSPANAPWMMAVGNATHNVIAGNTVTNFVGGNTPPPATMVGASSIGESGQRVIVHASDFGNALCGAGTAELQGSCGENQGLSNPGDGETPFNGEIVVCDRGTYGRVEKGKNVLLAGAGGYILANTDAQGEGIVADEHCLPASHIGDEDGDLLREWLASGSGHGGRITDIALLERNELGDELYISSSRGPASPPADDLLKPNVIAPGTRILAASAQGQQFISLTGTSMSSPHVAGAAALLKSLHPEWNVSQISSAIEMTATTEYATTDGSTPATTRDRGAGRPVLSEAANAGLYLDVTRAEFLAADPFSGGEPRDLNLPGLADSSCSALCSFQRRVTDQMGGGNWSAMPEGFPEGVQVTVTPSNFSLGNGQSQALEIEFDLTQSGILNDWVSGVIRLTANGSSDLFMTASVYATSGVLPSAWSITDDRNGGWKGFALVGLAELTDATYRSGGLVLPQQAMATLVEDPSFDNPYDGGEGVFTTWQSLPDGALWLHAQTLETTAEDLDLFVGRDDNGDGLADAFEELCSSTSPDQFEKCDLYDLEPGDYWILVQNWTGTEPAGDEVTLSHAAIVASAEANFAVTGPGIVAKDALFPLRASWDNVDALPGEQYLGAVGIGSNRNAPNNVGVIPVRFNRSGIAAPETFPLMNGAIHHLALDGGSMHDRIFIDIPAGTNRLTIAAGGRDADQNNGLTLELKRADFSEAFSEPPFAAPAGDAQSIISADGVGGVGPSITVIGVQPGRWYAVLTNGNATPSAVAVQAIAEFEGGPIEPRAGLWEPNSRPGLGQGYEYNSAGPSQALVWYSYDEEGQPAWYIAGNPAVNGNIWTADLLRFTNDGAQQQSVVVGQASITTLAEGDQMFSYTLFGQSGSERMQPISPRSCPQVNGSSASFTGLWFRGVDGLGGASVLMIQPTQAQIHYLYDDAGHPRWLVAQNPQNPSPTLAELPMLQFTGYCAVCEPSEVSFDVIGTLERGFDSETTGNWLLDYVFNPPLSGSAERADSIVKITDTLDCP